MNKFTQNTAEILQYFIHNTQYTQPQIAMLNYH